MVEWIVALFSVLTAGAFIFVHEKGIERLKLPLKSLASLCFTALGAVCLVQSGVQLYGVLVLAALALGCIGDIFLQIPKGGDLCFAGGLAAFLLGHVIYIAAFLVKAPLAWIQPVVAAALLAVVWMLLRLSRADFGTWRLPVYAYAVVIAVMMGCASAVSPIVCIAAALFVVSDLVLALMRFAGRTQRGMSLLNLTTYYAAQILLALSVVL